MTDQCVWHALSAGRRNAQLGRASRYEVYLLQAQPPASFEPQEIPEAWHTEVGSSWVVQPMPDASFQPVRSLDDRRLKALLQTHSETSYRHLTCVSQPTTPLVCNNLPIPPRRLLDWSMTAVRTWASLIYNILVARVRCIRYETSVLPSIASALNDVGNRYFCDRGRIRGEHGMEARLEYLGEYFVIRKPGHDGEVEQWQ